MDAPNSDLKIENLNIISYDKDGDVALSDQQKIKIIEHWNEGGAGLSLDSIQIAAFGQKFDSRSKPVRAIKEFLASKNISTNLRPAKREIVLTEPQKQYIINNYNAKNSVEITKDIFEDKSLTALSGETRVVLAFIKETDSRIFPNLNPEIEADKDETESYNPPKMLHQAAARINKYVHGPNNGEDIDRDIWEKNSRIKSYLESLISFCHNQRFVFSANKYRKKGQRALFEGSFVSFVWDKVDLTTEEINLYIDICDDIVDESRIDSEIEIYTTMIMSVANDNDGKKTSMSISDHIHNLRDEKSKNKKRRMDLIEALQGKRSKRIENKRNENASVLNLVEAWKQEDKRNEIIEIAKKRKEGLVEELDKLRNMDQIKALLAGVAYDDLKG